MSPPRPASRRGGILVPLFSLASTRSWGIGEIGDLKPVTNWLASARQSLLQLLPINEMPPGESSPYSALSAMAIDPQFISIQPLEDFDAVGGEAALEPELRAQLDAVRIAPRIDYGIVRRLKLRRCAGRSRTSRNRMGRWTRRGAALRRLQQEVVVARRLRALPRVAREVRGAGVRKIGASRCERASRCAGRGASRTGG